MSYPKELADLVAEATTVYRKGDPVEYRQVGGVAVTDVYGYGPVPESTDGQTLVDLVFVVVGVKNDACASKEQIGRWVADWHSPTMPGGPSYIHTGGEVGSQEMALRLFALLSVTGFGDIMHMGVLAPDTPADEVREMAGQGMLYFVPKKEFAQAWA